MSAPDHSDTVLAVAKQKQYDLTTKLGCGGPFLEDVVDALHTRDPHWKHLQKVPGQNQWNGHAVDAVLWHAPPGGSQAIDLIKAGESTDASVGWNPDVIRPIYDDRATAPKGPCAFVLPPHQTRLGCSLFWLMAGYRSYRQQLEANLEWIRDTLHADYIRAFAVVGGDTFPTAAVAEATPEAQARQPQQRDGAVPDIGRQTPAQMAYGDRADPWQYAGSFLSWPDYDAVFQGAHDLAASYGISVAWTLVGGRAQVPTSTSQLQLCDRIAGMLAPRLATVELIECWNEYTITGGSRDELRAMAERLRTRLGPTVLIALDTPETAMGNAGEAGDPLPADTTMLYKGSAANCITPQWSRQEPNPRDMGPDAPAVWYSHEPRGPGASAGGDVTDPLQLADDYMQGAMVIAKGPPQAARGNTSHWKAGVWGGHCHPAFGRENTHANLWDHDPEGTIAAALAHVRAGGTVMPGDDLSPDKPPPAPTVTDRLLTGESLKAGAQLVSPGKTCQAMYDLDGNFVLYTSDGVPVWASQTGGTTPGSVQMNPDGNLVIVTAEGTPVWASHTDGHLGAMVQLQDDHNLVIYADPAGPEAGTPLWSSAGGLV